MSVFGRRLQSAVLHTTPPTGGDLALPRIAWEGGPAYWNQFSKTVAASWTSDTFFPIISFSNSFSDASEIAWDKSLGINCYHGLNPWSPYDLLDDYSMFYIGDAYTYQPNGQTMPSTLPNWVGYNVPDEIDGTSGDGPTGLASVSSMTNAWRALNDGRFIQANYTQMVCRTGFQPYGAQYINHPGVDAVSLDMYWYTIPDASFGGAYVSDVNGPTNARRATSYGAMVSGMRQLDAQDSSRKPIWMFIEALSGSPGEQFVRYTTPDEIKGATMSSLIHEARGIMWFNNVASQGYSVGNVFRQAQISGASFVGYNQVMAVSAINAQILSLAPVLNTQSYVWTFGSNLETMLKVKSGYAYIFAMCSNASTPGSRTFTLPPDITGTSASVVGESRSLTVSGGQFTDTFAAEYSYHIYRIAL